jgi:hypothetical protein
MLAVVDETFPYIRNRSTFSKTCHNTLKFSYTLVMITVIGVVILRLVITLLHNVFRILSCNGHDMNARLNWLILWSWMLEKWTVSQPFKKSPASYKTWRFNTVFTKACHWSVSRWIHSTLMHIHKHAPTLSYFSKILFNIILLCVGFPSNFFFSGFPTKTVYDSCPLHGTCPTHLSLISGEDSKFYSSSLCSFLQPPSILSLLGANVLRTLSSYTLCYSLYMRDQLSHKQL